ncbi:glycosyltransferase [Neisseria lisongii]|uniref:Glycosyltransferase n=1 Tax=Neisseria lisongii TaxID=2912188 RepID=A0AAW5AKL9_9NEIS|nr:glycosyltransferase [Neisseria lisongii]MCF7530398.1 glycosyltransferase [Neisseria lisongii]
MNITIVAPFCSLPDEPYFNRFQYLAQRLAQRHNVLLLTSNFRHFDKTFRPPVQAAAQGRLKEAKIELLAESGYAKNVSLQRLISHHRLAQSLERRLQQCRPHEWDVVVSAYPLMATNLLLGKYKRRLGYKLIIDVQDVWPESFSAVLPVLKKIPPQLLPFARRADRAYRCADALLAVSQTYLQRAQRANPDVPAETVYIGADFRRLQSVPAHDFGDDTVRFFYLGTLSFSYDVATVCQGVAQLADEGYPVALHIMGGGPNEAELRRFAHPALHFHGYLPYDEMMSLAKGCDIAVNPIHSHAMQSVTNKFSDYMALQKPVISSQTDPEVRSLLTLLPHAQYRSGDVAGFVAAAKTLLASGGGHVQSQAVRERFDRETAYRTFEQMIERLTHE